jgi:hypothetical protein
MLLFIYEIITYEFNKVEDLYLLFLYNYLLNFIMIFL